MNRPWTKTYGPDVALEIDPDAYPSTVALFNGAVAKYGDRPAFECFGRTMTYAEVERASRAFDALRQDLAQLDSPPIVRIDPPDRALGEHAVLAELRVANPLACGVGRSYVIWARKTA
jgi:hypothetical protein